MVLSMNAGTQGFDEARGRDLYQRAAQRQHVSNDPRNLAVGPAWVPGS